MTVVAPPPCIVLAGGLGTRLRSVVADVPKCLAPVGRRSFLDLLLLHLQAAGIDEVVLSLGHGAAQVQAAVAGRSDGPDVRCVVEPTLLGTGGAIAHVMDCLGLEDSLVTNGDTWLECDLAPMLRPLQLVAGERFRMATVEVENRGRYGGVQKTADGRVSRFLEKGQTGPGAINAGLYRLHRGTLPVRRAGPFSLESDVLPGLAAAGSLWTEPLSGSFIDIGVPEDYHRFCARYGD